MVSSMTHREAPGIISVSSCIIAGAYLHYKSIAVDILLLILIAGN
nr:MAG TPA_asm: hypothetical protein [Caudoviricetes sp.]